MRTLIAPLSPPAAGNPRDLRGRRTCWWWAGVLAGCAAVLLVLVETGWGPLCTADRFVAVRLHEVATDHPAWTRTARILTDWVWDPVTIRLLALAATAFLVLRRAARPAVWFAVTTAVGLGVQAGVKWATGRARPRFPDPVDSAHTEAFPSGHAMTATVIGGLLLMLLVLRTRSARLRAAGWAAAVVSVAGVGFTRVFLGVHWWTDVLAGWLLGGTVLAACSAVFVPWRGTRGAKS